MANYSSDLKTWGDSGAEYPTGYKYEKGVRPVDAWDNYFNRNAERDIQHLISLTNSRLESGSGNSYPGSPETGELSFRTDKNTLEFYNGTTWKELSVYGHDHSGEHIVPGSIDTGSITATSVNGISSLESTSGAQQKVDSHESSTSGVHGVGTSNVESEAGAQQKADSAETAANNYTNSEISATEMWVSNNFNHYTDNEARSAVDGGSFGHLAVTNRFENAVVQSANDLPTNVPVGTQVYVQSEGEIYVYTE